MKAFTDLYLELDETTRTSEKVAALTRYFRTSAPLDAAWAVFVMSGRKFGKAISSRLLRAWATEASGYPAWLLDQCYHVVGDLSETLSLLLPAPPTDAVAPPLHEVIEKLVQLSKLTAESQRQIVRTLWDQLDTEQRLVFHKLLSGSFRVGVSKLLLSRALAEAAGVEPAIIAHRLAGQWTVDESTMPRLLGVHDPTAPRHPGVPYPFMLAHALMEPPSTLGEIGDWLIEYKWDGIRAQLIRRAGQTTLWSRGDEAVGNAFPEIVQAASQLPDETVLDGEILGWNPETDRPLAFTRLQRRLNRQHVEMTFWPETPVVFIAFDALEAAGRDIRSQPLQQRHEALKAVCAEVGKTAVIRASSPVTANSWDEIELLVRDSRERGVEGVMLKRKDAAYHPGRPTGLWWKLKVEPFTMDAVLISAEPGHGRRAGLLTDYTFGVWDGDELVPIAKAYSGLTDVEIGDVDRFIRKHTTARRGPVHLVEPLMVFEIGFEAIQASPRHKAGVAVRFPRMLRQRTDKTPRDADQLQTMQALLARAEAQR